MADATDTKPRVTDAEIEKIIEENEAGVADLMAAYEPIARQYTAVSPQGATVTYGIDTYPR